MRSLTGRAPFPRGLPTRGARPVEQVSLEDALTRRWDDDRHLVLYTASTPYRINNAALEGQVRAEVRLLAFDVDNHEADAAGQEAAAWMEGEREKIATLLAVHPGAFVHTTSRGWRALYALPAPFPIGSEADKEAFALEYARIAAYVFERFGIVMDEAFTRWNQPMRLPHVVRDGRVFDAEVLAGDAAALGAFELPACVPARPDLRGLAAASLWGWKNIAKRWAPKREHFRVATAAFDHVPLPLYPERVASAERWARAEAPRAVMRQRGRATARSVAATLYVGFALERADVERILIGAYNRRRCSPPWGEGELGDLRGIAQKVARTPQAAWGFMLTRDRTGIAVARARLEEAASSRQTVALEDVPSRLVAAMEEHRAVVLRATYGAGKTHAVARYVATETRGRVIVVVPRHEVARAWVAMLAAAGEQDVAYHASVVQRRDAEGRRHCDNRIALKLHARGGDVARDVCPSCPRASTCPAYATPASPPARVHVLPREMIGKIEVTAEDLVVFDDAAVDLVAWHRLGVRQLRRLGGMDPRMLPASQHRYLRIFVDALLVGARGAEAHARAALEALGFRTLPSDALRYVAQRLVHGQRSPRVPPDMVALTGDAFEETLRDVSTLRHVLCFAEAYAAEASLRWSEDERTVHGEGDALKLLRAHQGRLVVLDAAANVEELRAVRPDLHVEHLDVEDAGDTHRTLLFATQATRTGLQDPLQRRARLDLWLGGVLGHLTSRKARRPVFVVYKSIEADVRKHPALVAWCAEDARREVRVAHFGALRGSNRFQRCDAVVTLGDPWLHGDDVIGRAEWLGLDEPSYRVALATAELGQAHGRSRSVRRRRRLTHVHVGRLVPDGWGHGVEVEPLGGPPERTRGTDEREEFGALVEALGGQRATAVHLGVSGSAVAGWKSGRRGLPRDVLARARAASAMVHNPTGSSDDCVAGGAITGMDAPPCIKEPRERVHGDGDSASDAAVSAVPAWEVDSAGPSALPPSEDSPPSHEEAGHEWDAPGAYHEGAERLLGHHSQVVPSDGPATRRMLDRLDNEMRAREVVERFEAARCDQRRRAVAFAESLNAPEPLDLERLRAARAEVEAELAALRQRRREAG